jgi:predicted phage-related endonuclease
MGATGADHGWVVACVGGNKLYRGRIERHEPTQQKIAEAIAAFWHNVRAENPPTSVADYESVAKAYAFGEKESAIDLTEAEGIEQLIDTYLAEKEELAQLEVKVETSKGRIAAHLGTNTKAKGNGFRITWPVINRAEKMMPARIQKALTYRGAMTIVKEAK